MTDGPGPRYELTGRVADSATATVWRAWDRELGRVVAIKALHRTLADRADLRARLREEARVLGGITSAHVVAVYDFVEAPEQVWLVEEWVDGATLRRVREQAGRLTAEQAVGVVRGALTGLAAVHELGLIHRDVSPSNILVTSTGGSMLVDFGVAAPAGTSGAVGTPAYMSPEAVESRELTPASDVYSAAAVLASLLTGGEVFPGGDVERVLARHLDPAPPDLSAVSAGLREVLLGSLALAPSQRPVDAAALLALLEDAATRDLGAGWLARAGVASLSTAAVTTYAAKSVGRAVHRTGRLHLAGGSAKAAVAGVSVLAVGGAAVTVALVSSGGSATPKAAVPTTAAASPSTAAAAPTTTVATLPTSAQPSVAASTVPIVATSSSLDPNRPVKVAGAFLIQTVGKGQDSTSCFLLRVGKTTYELEDNDHAHAMIASYGPPTYDKLDATISGLFDGETPANDAKPKWRVGTALHFVGTVRPQDTPSAGCHATGTFEFTSVSA